MVGFIIFSLNNFKFLASRYSVHFKYFYFIINLKKKKYSYLQLCFEPTVVFAAHLKKKYNNNIWH